MKVIFNPEAKAQLRRRRAWWKKNRDNRALFTQTIRAAAGILEDAPKLQVHGMRDGVEVRRLSLRKVHCFVYYVILEDKNRVEIISVWGQEMAHQPDFADTDP